MVAMGSDRQSRIGMPMAALGSGGAVVSRIGLGLAALGRPAYITSGREDDLPDRSVAGMRTPTFSMLDAAYAAGARRGCRSCRLSVVGRLGGGTNPSRSVYQRPG
jgi:hypothetical protein